MVNSSTSIEEVLESYLERLALELFAEIPLEKVTVIRGSEGLLRELMLKTPSGTYKLTFGIDITVSWNLWVSLKKEGEPKSFKVLEWGVKRVYKLPVQKLAEAISKWVMSNIQV